MRYSKVVAIVMKTLLGLIITALTIWFVSGLFVETKLKNKQTKVTKTNTSNVTLTVYYETYCPDCEDFILHQLYPVHASLREKLVVDFVPYGKAEKVQANGETLFYCQHGAKECEANKLHACAVRNACGESVGACPWTRRSILMEFIYCNMEHINRVGTGEECAKKAGLEHDEILKCAKSNAGSTLLSHFGDRTSNFTPAISLISGFVPSISIDGIPNFKASINLQEEICTMRPDIC